MHRIAAIGLALLGAFTATQASAQIVNDEDTLAIASVADNTSFDRARLDIGHRTQYWQPVFDTLIWMDPNGELHPNLATEWSYNEDNTILTLKLREGIKFTDGEVFDSEAVKANLEYLKNGAGQNAYMTGAITEYDIIGLHEIALHLDEPDPALLRNLSIAGGAMASPATFGDEEAATHPIGSGPYIYDVQNSVTGRQYVYLRNPDYWNPEAYDFDRIVITPMNDLVARVNAIKSGQVDVTTGTASSIADAEANGLTTYTKDVAWFGLTLADRGGKLVDPLADVRVRKAINMAIDGEAILKFIELGYGRMTDQLFPRESAAYDPELEDVYSYDPEGARALLVEAGYPDGFTISIPEISGFADFNSVVEQQLAEVGIKIDWAAMPPNSNIAEIRSGRYPVFLMNFGYEGDWGLLNMFVYPDSPFNPVKYEDPVLLEMVEEARFASGDEQVAKLKEINRYIVEQAWFNPWYRRDTVFFGNDTVEVEMQSGNIVPFITGYHKAGD